MAISPDIESGPFIGNGTQAAFAFTFTAISPAEVTAELDGVTQSGGFTVTLADNGGTVTFDAPPAIGAQIMLRSDPDYLQDSAFENEGAYNLATVNTINRRQAVRALVNKKRLDGTSVAAADASAAAAAASATAAAGAAGAAAGSAGVAGASAGSAASSANTAANAASGSALAAATAGVYPNAAAANVPRGLTQASVGTITGGSGGTNGTFALAWSSGNFSINPTGTFTVTGGVVTAVTITGPGLYIGASPTVPTPSFAASSGMSGAAVVLSAQFLVVSGNSYWVQSADNSQLLRFSNVAGVATVTAGVGPTSLASALLANSSLGSLIGIGETIGIAPAADTAGVGPGALIFINTAATYDSTLDSFTASVRTVGNGTARLVAVLNAYAANSVVVIGDVNLTGISSNGVKTFTAGVDYNLLDANGQPIVFPAGTRFALGSTTAGGVGFDVQVSIGAGFSIPGTAGGYNTSQQTGTNFIGKFQVTLGRVKTVRSAINAATALPVTMPGEAFATDYVGPDALVFNAVGDQGQAINFGNGFGFYNDGQIIGVQYASVVAGDVLWLVFRGSQIVDWRRATIALGDRLTSTFSTPFAVKASDKLYCFPLTGYLKSQSWSAQPGSYSNSNVAWNGATFISLNVQTAMRAIVQRPRKSRVIAAAASRGSTVTLDQHFRGTTLPGNTTFTATTTNGSYALAGIVGTPIVGAPITGTGLTVNSLPYIVSVSGNAALMSQPATASGAITVTQTGWAAAGTGTWTCSDGLVSPSSASTDWARRYISPVPTNAQRRTFTAAVYIGDLTNVGGICSQAQQASLVTTLGSVIHIDAPNNMFRAYLFGANVGVAPSDAGLSVVAPWTLAATDWVIITTQIDRGQQTITFTNAKTGQSAQIISRWSSGALSRSIHAGVFSGQPGAHFLQGNGGMKWDFMRNTTHVANRGPRKFWYHDSTCHLTSDNWEYNWINRVEDRRGKGDFLNCAKAGTTALGVLSTLPQDFSALNPGLGDEVFWGVGVNVDNHLGTTDAQRYLAWKTSTLAAINTFLQAGCSITLVTPTPSNALPSYVPLVINGILTGDLGNFPSVNVGQAVSQSLDGALWIALYSQDNLHPFEQTGAPFLAANFLAQRPDMNGDV